MILVGSRYQTVPVFYMLDGRSGKTQATVLRDNQYTAPSYNSASWPDGARLDFVAYRTTNGSGYWWKIMDQNADIIDPMSLDYGMIITLP